MGVADDGDARQGQEVGVEDRLDRGLLRRAADPGGEKALVYFVVACRLGCSDHIFRRRELCDRALARAALEIRHLLHDVSGRQAREACILRSSGSVGSMAEAAGV